ncbi:MAG: glutamate--tRNA ligase [Candidatus Shapirobacteria bacterium]
MKNKVIRTRFAPSPTGFIHIGGIYSALLNFAYAKKNKGSFILRLEDTDQKRLVKNAENQLYRGLTWIGLNPDEGPYRQSERLEIYQKYAQKLISQKKAYYCFCSEDRLEKIRKGCQKKGKPSMYDRHCRGLDSQLAQERLKKGEKAVVRMKIPENEIIMGQDLIRGKIKFDSRFIDDQIILKSNGFPTYHLAALVDDHLMKITHVVRGHEWLPSFPKHILLYRYLKWKMPQFLHTPVLLDPAGGKLSKRKNHASLSYYREKGFLPEAILNYLGQLGWSHPKEKEIFPLKEFIKYFDLKDVSPVSPTFDLDKLEWINGVYLRSKTNQGLASLLRPFLPKMSRKQIQAASPLVKERIKILSEASDLLEFVWSYPDWRKELMIKKVEQEMAKEMLKNMKIILEKYALEKTEILQKKTLDLIKKKNWKVGDFFMILRIAVCGKTITPPILESLILLGKKETIKRVNKALRKLQ